jgi:UDP-glucose 4-epimerase
MQIHGDGRQERTFTFVADTVDALVRTLDMPAADGQILNVGSSRPTAILDLATRVQAALGLPPPLRAEFVPYESFGGRYQDVRRRVPDTERSERVLGFAARVPLDEGLRRTMDWHRERRGAGVATAVAAR